MENAHFETTVRMTWESCLALARAKAGQHSRVVWISNIMIALGVAVLWIIGSKHAIWMSVLLALLLAQTLLRVWISALRHYGGRNKAVDEIHASFGEEGIRIRTRVEESLVRYDDISALKEDGIHMIILMRHHIPLVIPKDGLESQWKALVRLLEQKTGLEFRYIG